MLVYFLFYLGRTTDFVCSLIAGHSGAGCTCTTNDYHLPRGTLPHGTEKCVTNREVVIRIDTLHAASNRLTDDI
jgi:hypothetical protein